MPAKIDADSNLRFLYACFKHSNYTSVNYPLVAADFGIKAPAARMRLMRLKIALDHGGGGGGGDGHCKNGRGAEYSGGVAVGRTKKKKGKGREKGMKGKEKRREREDYDDDDCDYDDDEDEDEEEEACLGRSKRKRNPLEECKEEDEDKDEGEDDAPLAKRRQIRTNHHGGDDNAGIDVKAEEGEEENCHIKTEPGSVCKQEEEDQDNELHSRHEIVDSTEEDAGQRCTIKQEDVANDMVVRTAETGTASFAPPIMLKEEQRQNWEHDLQDGNLINIKPEAAWEGSNCFRDTSMITNGQTPGKDPGLQEDAQTEGSYGSDASYNPSMQDLKNEIEAVDWDNDDH